MSKHIQKSFQADPFGWAVTLTTVFALVFLLNTCILDKRVDAVEENCIIDAVPVSE